MGAAMGVARTAEKKAGFVGRKVPSFLRGGLIPTGVLRWSAFASCSISNFLSWALASNLVAIFWSSLSVDHFLVTSAFLMSLCRFL
jgi:hypothetical protein